MEQVQASFAVAAGGTSPRDRLERLVRAALGTVRENLAFWRLTYQLRMQPGVLEGLGDAMRAWPEAIRLHLEGLLRDAGVASPEVEARVLFAAIDGAAQHFALDPDRYPVDDVAAAIVRRFLPPTPADGCGRQQETSS